MPIPRHRDIARRGDPRRPVAVTPVPWMDGHTLTDAEQQRRYRAGDTGGKGRPRPVWAERRNGLPVKPYVYRGSGADAITGEVVL